MMRLTMILKFLFICGAAYSQVCFIDANSYTEIDLKKILSENNRQFDCLLFKTYTEEDFSKVAGSLKERYFEATGNVLSKKDSVEVSVNIEKISSRFYQLQRKDIRKIKKLARRYHTKYHLDESLQDVCRFIIEPCYTLEIEDGKPLAFVVKTNYRLLDQDSSEIYRVVIP